MAAALVLMLVVLPARADEAADLQSAKQHYQKGAALFDLGRYDEAIKEYEAAYEVKSDPSFLFNIAQAHRKAQHVEQALHFYRAYLARAPQTDARAYVEERIRELEKQVSAAPPRQPPPPETTPPPPTTTRPTPARETKPAVVMTPPPSRQPVRTRLVAGTVVGVVGLGLAAGGIALTVLSANAANQLTNADRNHLAYDPKLYSTYQNDAIGGGIMLAVGAAALATGGALIAIDIKRHHETRGSLARN
jgi:tetratricopeptide (TPR) repeat protein